MSEPALAGAEEAFAYLTALKLVMIYGGISDCDMEKGQLRCDANVSIRPVGRAELGTKVELKNLNSISYVRDGIAHEIKRQIGVVLGGGTIGQETRDYDGQTGVSQSLRSKEMAHDYRYFPDPDLMPVQVDDAVESPHPRRLPGAALRQSSGGFSPSMASSTPSPRVLVPGFGAQRFLRGNRPALGAKPQAAGNWIANDLLRELAAAKQPLAEAKVRPAQLAALIKLVDAGDAFQPRRPAEVFAARWPRPARRRRRS